jgi:hypothetical protein
MKTILVGYDLNKPGKDYRPLITKLKSFQTWWHHLDSTWLIRTSHSVVQVRDMLWALMDANDELLVVDVTGDVMAWAGIAANGSNWLKNAA